MDSAQELAHIFHGLLAQRMEERPHDIYFEVEGFIPSGNNKNKTPGVEGSKLQVRKMGERVSDGIPVEVYEHLTLGATCKNGGDERINLNNKSTKVPKYSDFEVRWDYEDKIGLHVNAKVNGNVFAFRLKKDGDMTPEAQKAFFQNTIGKLSDFRSKTDVFSGRQSQNQQGLPWSTTTGEIARINIEQLEYMKKMWSE